MVFYGGDDGGVSAADGAGLRVDMMMMITINTTITTTTNSINSITTITTSIQYNTIQYNRIE